MTRFAASGLLFAFTIIALGCGGTASDPAASTSFDLTPAQIQKLAREAYIYGEAPIDVAVKTHDQTNSTSSEAVYAPINALFIDTQTNTPSSALWVSPNVNVLYASAHMDLTQQPMLLYTPAVAGRYYSWEIMDAYTNAFHYVGSRATSGAQGTYALVGPDTPDSAFRSSLPPGTTVIRCPQNSVWMVGRFEVKPGDQADLDTVIALVRTNVLLPLDKFVSRIPSYVNPIITKPGTTVPSLNTTGLQFFTVLNEWMTKNPPPSADDPVLQEFAKIGIGPGLSTNFHALPIAQQEAMLAGAKEASAILTIGSLIAGDVYNGWRYNLTDDFGNWGTSYLLRGMTARGGLGANINQEAIYPLLVFDDHIASLLPDRKYEITFPAGQLPLVNNPGFWSITMYDRTSAQLVDNPIDRYSIGSQNSLTVALDGSITIYIQRDDPRGTKTNNWLPTAESGSNPFYLIFRAYNPNPIMYTPYTDPGYKVPAVKRVP